MNSFRNTVFEPPPPPISPMKQVPDLNNYPMFSVKCLEATESLAKKAEALHTLVRLFVPFEQSSWVSPCTGVTSCEATRYALLEFYRSLKSKLNVVY